MARILSAIKCFLGLFRGRHRGSAGNSCGNIIAFGSVYITQCSCTEIVNEEKEDASEA